MRRAARPTHAPGRSIRPPRRGVAILVVLVVISVAFTLSYAIMRSQGTAVLIQHNAGLGASARQAAATGLAMALKKMHTDEWAGVDTTLSGSLGESQRFEVAFTTGDPSLAAGDAEYAEYPYRVTLLSTGYATDPIDSQRVVTHRMRAVVRLVPRKLADEPAGWSDLTGHTVCQWTAGECRVNVPARIEGPVRVRGPLDLAKSDLEWSGQARWRYLQDLNLMRQAGTPDWRPLVGPVKIYYLWQYADTLIVLNTGLGVATSNASPFPEYWPTSLLLLDGYRLYPGGKTYTPVAVQADLGNVTLEPDPKTNPLGIYARYGEVKVHDNVTLRGTLVTLGGASADVQIDGRNVRLEPPPAGLPPLAGSDVAIRLPAVVSSDDIRIHRGTEVGVQGMMTAADEFVVDEDGQEGTAVEIQGRVAARDVIVKRRAEWNRSADWWNQTYNEYDNQRDIPGGIKYFPEWLKKSRGLDPQPRIAIAAGADKVRYHWQNPNDPLYVPHPDDATELDPDHPGLRWEIVGWTDNPRM